jgi:hypothetical protein
MTDTNKEVKVFADKTIAQKFAEIRDLPSLTEEMREFLDKEIDKVVKKNAHKGKANKEKSEKQDKIEGVIMEVLAGASEPLTATLISIAVGTHLGEYVSTQKITPRCKALVNEGLIEKITEKKVNKYKVAE